MQTIPFEKMRRMNYFISTMTSLPVSTFFLPLFGTLLLAMVCIQCTCSPSISSSASSDNPLSEITEPDRLDTALVDWPAPRQNETQPTSNTKFRGIQVVDREYLMAEFVDGEVIFSEDTQGECAYGNCFQPKDNHVVHYGAPLRLAAAISPVKWRITSLDDPAYGTAGRSPIACYRKSKLNGMAQFEWSHGDYRYENTLTHWIYLQLPSPLVQGCTYTVQIAPETHTDITQQSIRFDVFSSPSEAIHINLVGYRPDAPIHDADLYLWMGDGGARDYSGFEGNKVYIQHLETKASTVAGKVSFWKPNQPEAHGYHLIQSPVWNVDFTGSYVPGAYRLVVEGVGASRDFVITDVSMAQPFRTVLLGYFYMRIGQDSPDMRPALRRPLWIPNQDPVDCRVVVTDMHPWHPDWNGEGDRWDQPAFFSKYVKPGAPTNPRAVGGHSDARDWDRHLGHVVNIYDMLLPYLLTESDGELAADNVGIAESGNGVPDIIDEARNEVDFWLALRFNGGYSHGLSNPDERSHVLYQADNTALAAWANAVNAAMLAQAYSLAGFAKQKEYYLGAAVEAWNHATTLSNQMLDESEDTGSGRMTGRDFRMTAAAWLYRLTGRPEYERIVNEDTLVKTPTDEFFTENRNQLYALAAYLGIPREKVRYPIVWDAMKKAVRYQAARKEADFAFQRPSRRSTDNEQGYFHTAQFVLRTILAHAASDSEEERHRLEQTLLLEASYGLGRNPANMIQMTTASTTLQTKRSVEQCYTTGSSDGTPGLHPGHTPYMNMDDWAPHMVMGRPSWLAERCFPTATMWPRGELFFNTRYIWAHGEFTPRQTMRGKIALYGYLLGIGANK